MLYLNINCHPQGPLSFLLCDLLDYNSNGSGRAFCKKMKTILLLNCAGNLLVGINYLFSESYSGSTICLVAAVGVIINYTFTYKDKAIPKWVIGLHTAAFLGVNLLTFTVWYDIFALAASMLFVLSVAQNSAKYYRILFISNSLVWILYDVLAGAYANLLTHAVLAAATLSAILYRDIIKKDISDPQNR